MSLKINSSLNMIESSDEEIIKAGGPSKSELFNKLRDGLVADILAIDSQAEDNKTKISDATAIFNTQLAALSTRISSIDAKVPSAQGRWLIDFFSNALLDGANTALINTVYGQITLPILFSQEKLVGIDSQGKVWLPKSTVVEYSYLSSTPNEEDWILDDNFTKALDLRNDTAWLLNRGSSGTVWVRITPSPGISTVKKSNIIIFHPYPVLTNDILSVEYQNTSGIWTNADLSYQLGWDSGTSKIVEAGNIRLLIPETQVTQVRVKMNVTDAWGFGKISMQQVEFDASASVVVDFTSFNPGTIGSVTVNGKDPSTLALLTTGINGNKVTVDLNRDTQNTSPLITGIEAKN